MGIREFPCLVSSLSALYSTWVRLLKVEAVGQAGPRVTASDVAAAGGMGLEEAAALAASVLFFRFSYPLVLLTFNQEREREKC